MSQSVGLNCIVTTDNHLNESKEYGLDERDASEICDKYRNNNLIYENKSEDHFCDDEIITVVVSTDQNDDDNCGNYENNLSGREITVIINDTKNHIKSPTQSDKSSEKNFENFSEKKCLENGTVSHKDDKSPVNYPKSIQRLQEIGRAHV